MTQTRLDWSVPFGQTWIFDKNDAVNGDFSWIFDSGVTVASSSNLLLYHVTNNNISISAVLNCPNSSYITLTKGANQHQFTINKTAEKPTPDVPDDGGQEVQYTTIYWGWTDATHMFKDAQNSIDPTIYPELTLLDPTTVDFKVSGNGVTANTVNVSGNRWQSPVVDVDSRRTLYVAVPTGWGIERWVETLMGSPQDYIQQVQRGDYVLYYNYFPSLEYNDQQFVIKKN